MASNILLVARASIGSVIGDNQQRIFRSITLRYLAAAKIGVVIEGCL